MSLEVTTCLGCTRHMTWREDRLCRDCRQKKHAKAASKKHARWNRERRKGYLGTEASIDAYLSGRPMSSDDY